jgi:hypothetical protein
VWAKYGTQYGPDLWKVIVAVTHWTSADVEREAKLRENIRTVEPDFTIDQFSQLLPIVNLLGNPERQFTDELA